jgi:hypothetical protein
METFMSHIYAFMTGTRSDLTVGQRDSHGWVDPTQGRTSFWESRNDVCPVVDWPESVVASYYDSYDEMVRDYVLAALSELPQGFEDHGDGTYAAMEPELSACGDDPGFYTYEIHFVRKSHGPDGWTEKPWHPSRDGGVRL